MTVLRSVFSFLVCVLPCLSATFGTVVPDPRGTGLTDLVLDEGRRRLYAVNTTMNLIEVFNLATNPPTRTLEINPRCTSPISAAMSRSNKYLYVTCYDQAVLARMDLDNVTAAPTMVSLAAKPQGVAVAYDEKVLVSTIGTGQGRAILLWYDPTADASRNLQDLTTQVSPPSAPQLPPPSGRAYESGRGRLLASRDGRVIVGVNELSNNTRAVFVYDAVSTSVLRSRIVSNLSPVLSIHPDNSRFMAGLIMFDTKTLQVLSAQNAANSPFLFPGGGANNFNTQQNQGGSVFAPDGSYVYSAFNIAPTQNPPARANVSRLLVNDPDNMLIHLGIQLQENLAGKMVITADGRTVYALSESGFVVLPIANISQYPIAMPETSVLMLANDQCGVTADQRALSVNVKNMGGTLGTTSRGMTVTAQLLQVANSGPTGLGGVSGPGGGGLAGAISFLLPPQLTRGLPNIGVGTTNNGFGNTGQNTQASTSPQVRVTQESTGANLTFNFSSSAARALGTVPPHDFLIQSAEAINIPPNVRVYQNNRNAEARGRLTPIPIGTASSEGLVDMLLDNTRQRIYIANSGMNRIEVYDMRRQQLLTPIKVGQLPRSLAFGTDGASMYVANTGGENLSIVDLDRLAVVGRVKFPPTPFNASSALVYPAVLAGTQRGPQMIMSDGTLWKVVGDEARPRVLPSAIFGSARTITGPVRTMAASPEGRWAILLAGNGYAYLYSADQDEFVNARQIMTNPIQGYYGPVAAGPNGNYYLVNGYVLNSSLTIIGTAPSFTVSGSTIVDPTTGLPAETPGTPSIGPTPGIGGTGLPSRGGPTTVSRPVSAVAAVGANQFARFSMPIRLNQNATVTDAGSIELVTVDVNRSTTTTIGMATSLEGPLSTGSVTARINTNGRTLVVDAAGTTAYAVTASGLSVMPIDRTAVLDTPTVPRNGVVNSGSMATAVAPNTLVSIFGRNLAATSDSAKTNNPLPTVLGGVCVTLNNVPMPLLGVSGTQINAQLPPTLNAGRYSLIVRSIARQAASSTNTLAVTKYAPAVLMDANGKPMIYHKDGRLVDKDHPAKRDEPLYLYATGLGATKGGRVVSGMPSPASPLAVTDKVQLYFGNPLIREAEVIVDWSGLEPGYVGVYRINARVPGAHVKGNAIPVTLRIGGVDSPTTGPVVPAVYVE
jgi:uncharacterized protein (TIGR03437 family)